MLSMLKKKPLRSKPFRKWIASQPCMKCGLEGRTQAAHMKGASWGAKAGDDTCRPLCTVHWKGFGMVLGCHEKLDQHLEKEYWEANKQRALDLSVFQLWVGGYEADAEMELRRFRNDD